MKPAGIRGNPVANWALAGLSALVGGVALAEAVVNAPGSVVGFTAVVGGWLLGTNVRPDVWTWGGAVLQVPAGLLAVLTALAGGQ